MNSSVHTILNRLNTSASVSLVEDSDGKETEQIGLQVNKKCTNESNVSALLVYLSLEKNNLHNIFFERIMYSKVRSSILRQFIKFRLEHPTINRSFSPDKLMVKLTTN